MIFRMPTSLRRQRIGRTKVSMVITRNPLQLNGQLLGVICFLNQHPSIRHLKIEIDGTHSFYLGYSKNC